MLTKVRRISLWVVVGAVLLSAVVPVMGQRGRIAIFVQAAAPVPTADLELLQNFAQQHGAIITGARVSSTGELMQAQRATNTYIGNTLSVEGIRRLANALDVDHIIIFRIVRWESQLSFQPARSLLLLGATSFADNSLKLLLSPLGILLGLQKEATVGLFATVFSPKGDIEFATSATSTDRPFLSLLTADPLEAAKQAIDTALYQIAVTL